MSGMTMAWTIKAPVQAVWDGATNLSGYASATGVKTELLTEGPFAVGTRWREYHSLLGRESAQEWEVTRVQPPPSYRCESDSAGSHWVYDVFLVPDGDATRMFSGFDVVPGGVAARVGNAITWPLFGLVLRRSSVKLGADFARWVEATERA